MAEGINFDYYYGIEAEQFTFYRVPRLLIKDKKFKGLSSDAKLLYGLMLDRMSLSIKNGWFDKENRAYIYYTVDEIVEDLGCSHGTCTNLTNELKRIGLIEKKRQGLGKPDIIYVKNFVSSGCTEPGVTDKKPENSDVSTEVQNLDFQKSSNKISGNTKTKLPEVQILDFRKSKNQISGNLKNGLQEIQKLDKNYTDINNTELNYNNINQSINLSELEKNEQMDGIDDTAKYIEQIKNNIRYDYHMQHETGQDMALFDELFGLICDAICVKRRSMKIGGEDYPYELVKAKFLKLTDGHLKYVIEAMQNTTVKIANIKAYMLAVLYNAPNTMAHYYKQMVQHDMYGGGWAEKGIV